LVNAHKNLVGLQFGGLKVLQQCDDHISSTGRHDAKWKCLCNCGKVTYVVGRDLLSGSTRSCGCNRKEYFRNATVKNNNYIEQDGYLVGYDQSGESFLVDKADYDLISKITWNVENVRCNYKRVSGHFIGGERVLLHQYLMGCKYIDHINRNPLDNRRENLRKATFIENARNKGMYVTNSSGVIGVRNRNGHWNATINNNGHVWLGTFSTKEEAIKARLDAESKYYGEFAPQRNLFEQYNINGG